MRRFDRFLVMHLIFAIILSSCVVKGDRESLYTSNEAYSAFIHVNVIPMTQEIILEDQTVLIAGDRILAIGPTNRVFIPPEGEIIDGDGAYLMPGLADMHVHTNQNWDTDTWPVSPLYLYLANGVTAIRDFGPTGDELTYVLEWRDQIQDGTRIGPTIYTSGYILFVSPLGDPRGLVQENFELGFDFLKLYSYLTSEDAREALIEAKELGMYTSGHVPYAIGLERILNLGMDEIAHVEELMPELIELDREGQRSPDAWLEHLIQSAMNQFDFTSAFDELQFTLQHAESMQHVIDELHVYKTPICTTMVVDEVIQQKIFKLDTFLAHPEVGYIPVDYRDRMQRGEEKHQLQCKGIDDLCAYKYGIDRWLLNELHEAEVPLLLGTDSGVLAVVPGFSIHDELRILVENGFTPYEAIATGTINAAQVVENMIGEGDFGTITIGNRADLILLRENPLIDLNTIREPLGVMAAGRWYPSELLTELIEIPETVE